MKGVLAFILCVFLCTANADIPSNALLHRSEMTKSAWRTFGLNAPIPVLGAQIHQESAWDKDAVSWAGAKGMAQFMPATAEDMAKRFPEYCAPANPFNPKWAFACRDRYLKSLIAASKNSETDECSDWAFGLRAYNGGLGWINKDRKAAKAAGKNSNDWTVVAQFNAGRKASAFKENKEYPERIFKLEDKYSWWGRELDCN